MSRCKRTRGSTLVSNGTSQGIPVLTWIDDFYITDFRSTRLLQSREQFEAAQVAAYFGLEVFYRAVYYIAMPKCVLKPTVHVWCSLV